MVSQGLPEELRSERQVGLHWRQGRRENCIFGGSRASWGCWEVSAAGAESENQGEMNLEREARPGGAALQVQRRVLPS